MLSLLRRFVEHVQSCVISSAILQIVVEFDKVCSMRLGVTVYCKMLHSQKYLLILIDVEIDIFWINCQTYGWELCIHFIKVHQMLILYHFFLIDKLRDFKLLVMLPKTKLYSRELIYKHKIYYIVLNM